MPNREESDEKKEVRADVKRYAVLDALARSEGGQMLLKGLKDDMIIAIETLNLKFKVLPESELRAICAGLAVNYNMFRTIQRSGKNRKDAKKRFDEILVEEPDDL